MSLPDDEVAERGRSIFERLRAERESVAGNGERSQDESSVSAHEPEAPADAPSVSQEASPVSDGVTPPPPTLEQPSAEQRTAEQPSAEQPAPDQPVSPAEGGGVSVDFGEVPADAPASSPGPPAPPPQEISAPHEVADRRPGHERAGQSQTPSYPAVTIDPAAVDAGHPAGETSVVIDAEPFLGGAPGASPPSMQPLQHPDLDAGHASAPTTATQAAVEEPAPARLIPDLPRILAVANQKGGVGKTTTTVNLGASLAELGYRVLVIDLDPQGNATTGLGINSRNLEHSLYDVLLHDVPLEDCIEPTTLRNLFVAPATIDLAGAEIELVPVFSRELRLRRAIEAVQDDFEYVLIDCPPSLGLLTVNGLAAATEVLVPIQCEYYALEGLGQLLRNVNLVQSNLNPALEVSTIVLTMYDARTKLAEQVADEVRSHFGSTVCRMVIPRTVRLSEAPSFGQPIIVFDPTSRGAIAYRELAKEVSGGAPQRTG